MLNAPSQRAPAIGTAIALALLVSMPRPAHAQSAIDWQLGDFAGQHGQRVALTVKALVDGHACTMQVDTGLDDAVAWHGDPAPARKPVDVAVEFAGVRVTVPTPADHARQLADCARGAVVGSLGNAFFDGGTLAIDLKTSHLRYAPGGRLAARLDAQPMFYARWGATGGHPLVEMRKSGALRGYALLDTGNAAVAFAATGKPQWDAATGGAPLQATATVTAFTASSSSRPLACFAAPSVGALQAGTWVLAAPLVTYCPSPDVASPLKLEGVVGLRSFGEAVVSIDYVSGRWLVEKAH